MGYQSFVQMIWKERSDEKRKLTAMLFEKPENEKEQKDKERRRLTISPRKQRKLVFTEKSSLEITQRDETNRSIKQAYWHYSGKFLVGKNGLKGLNLFKKKQKKSENETPKKSQNNDFLDVLRYSRLSNTTDKKKRFSSFDQNSPYGEIMNKPIKISQNNISEKTELINPITLPNELTRVLSHKMMTITQEPGQLIKMCNLRKTKKLKILNKICNTDPHIQMMYGTKLRRSGLLQTEEDLILKQEKNMKKRHTFFQKSFIVNNEKIKRMAQKRILSKSLDKSRESIERTLALSKSILNKKPRNFIFQRKFSLAKTKFKKINF